MSDIQTPNNVQFSIAAKLYLCAGTLLPPAGMMFGYHAPNGNQIDHRTLAKLIGVATVEDLERTGYISLQPTEFKHLIGSTQTFMVTANYSEAPGFSGRFLRATKWVPTDLVTMFSRLLPRAQAPLMEMLDRISNEFAKAGILTRGGYAAHGNSWDSGWLTYLEGALYPEAYDAWQWAQAYPNKPLVERSLMTAVAGQQHTERDMDDILD